MARGNVWLRGRLELELIEGSRDRPEGVNGLSESRGDVGLVTLAESDGAVSRDVVLWECVCR